MVKRRHVLHLAGYEPGDASAQYRRFVRQLAIFQRTWNVDTTLRQSDQTVEKTTARWSVESRAVDWRVELDYAVLVWDDIVRADSTRRLPARLMKAAATYFDFVATGTISRYVGANPNYAGFCIFPVLALALFLGAAWLCALLLTRSLGVGGATAGLVGVLGGFVVFLGLLRWPGRRWRVRQLFDDWIFAREYLLGRRSDIDARIDVFARSLVALAREADLDEIVIVGHSMGAMLAVDTLDRALALDPELGRHGAEICLLTVGATIPKLTLHPGAGELRRKVMRVAAEPSIAWAEYQARDDAINFYKFDPVSLERVAADRLDGKPVIRRVQVHEMVRPETFARFRFNMLRRHYQFVMANDIRAPYDYFLMACGPVSFRRWTISPRGLSDFIAADGAYLNSQAATPRLQPSSS